MIRFPVGKVYNSYILESYDYNSTKQDIKNFAIDLGFNDALVLSENHPDICYIEEPTKKIAVDDVRSNIINTVNFSPKIADKKIYVIYDSVNLDVNTQNSLLKTLEEPPIYDIFFLVTSNASKLLETIRSRCIILKDSSDKRLHDVLELEFIDRALFILANAKNENESDIMTFAEEFEKREDKFKQLIMLFRYTIRDAFAYKKTLSKSIINLREKENEIVNIANAYTEEEMGKFIDGLNKLSEMINLSINKKIAVYNFLMS